MGRPFVIAMSNYVVTGYHTELVQMIFALELADLSISYYSCIFDDSYSLLKSNVVDQLTTINFGSPQTAVTYRSHVGLFSQRDGSSS